MSYDRVIELIKEWVKLKDSSIKEYLLNQISQQMKRSYLNWNQSNVQDEQIWRDLETFAGVQLNIDYKKIIPVFQQQTNRKKPFFKRSNKKHYSRK